MSQRLVEHELTFTPRQIQVVRGSHSFIRVPEPRRATIVVIVDDDPAAMAALDIYLLRAGDEIPAGAGFMGVAADGTFVFGREVEERPSEGAIQ